MTFANEMHRKPPIDITSHRGSFSKKANLSFDVMNVGKEGREAIIVEHADDIDIAEGRTFQDGTNKENAAELLADAERLVEIHARQVELEDRGRA